MGGTRLQIADSHEAKVIIEVESLLMKSEQFNI
jgi:hypothetical protein